MLPLEWCYCAEAGTASGELARAAVSDSGADGEVVGDLLTVVVSEVPSL